jgi:hypothetical protein
MPKMWIYLDTQKTKPSTLPKMQITILEQTTQEAKTMTEKIEEPNPNQRAITKITQETREQKTLELLRRDTKAGILNQAIRRPHRDRLVPCGDVVLKALFSFPEELVAFHFSDIFESSFYELGCFLDGFCGFADVVIVLDTH